MALSGLQNWNLKVLLAAVAGSWHPSSPAAEKAQGGGDDDQAERSLLPMRGKGSVEKMTSTDTSKCSAILSAR